MASAIICQACGIEAPTKYVEFRQNIGALVMRFHKTTKGHLCKSCIHAHFWKRTLTTAAVGWLGTISLIVAPIFVFSNIASYLAALRLAKVPPGARIPRLDDEAVTKLSPVSAELIERLNRSEPLDAVAHDLGSRVGVTPGQVVHFVIALSQQRQQQLQQMQAKGFPVQPPPVPVPVIPLEQ